MSIQLLTMTPAYTVSKQTQPQSTQKNCTAVQPAKYSPKACCAKKQPANTGLGQ